MDVDQSSVSKQLRIQVRDARIMVSNIQWITLGWLSTLLGCIAACYMVASVDATYRDPAVVLGALCTLVLASVVCAYKWTELSRLARTEHEGSLIALYRFSRQRLSRPDFDMPKPGQWSMETEFGSMVSYVRQVRSGAGWSLPQGAPAPQVQACDAGCDQGLIASTLKAARDRACKTQEHVAAEADISVRTVRRAETDGRISVENLRAMCSVLDISLPVPGIPVINAVLPSTGDSLFWTKILEWLCKFTRAIVFGASMKLDKKSLVRFCCYATLPFLTWTMERLVIVQMHVQPCQTHIYNLDSLDIQGLCQAVRLRDIALMQILISVSIIIEIKLSIWLAALCAYATIPRKFISHFFITMAFLIVGFPSTGSVNGLIPRAMYKDAILNSMMDTVQQALERQPGLDAAQRQKQAVLIVGPVIYKDYNATPPYWMMDAAAYDHHMADKARQASMP